MSIRHYANDAVNERESESTLQNKRESKSCAPDLKPCESERKLKRLFFRPRFGLCLRERYFLHVHISSSLLVVINYYFVSYY